MSEKDAGCVKYDMQVSPCRNSGVREKPRLRTGEEFYTNVSRSGLYLFGGETQTLDEYIAELRTRFSSVQVSEMAVDIHGRQIENHVAVYVKE